MKLDSRLRQDVIDELHFNPSVTSENIAISVADGVVTISGFVPSYADKYASERAVFRVNGVKAIANELQVELPGSFARTDVDIARAAKDAFSWNVNIPESVQITVDHGVIVLRGEVDWAYQKESAFNAIRHLKGIKEVKNRIIIREKAKPGDIKSRIERALVRSAEDDAKKIVVDVADGKVILSGTVRSLAELEDAKWAAWATPGVTSVENHLHVSHEGMI